MPPTRPTFWYGCDFSAFHARVLRTQTRHARSAWPASPESADCPGMSAYCSSKAAVLSYCESLRGECRPSSVSGLSRSVRVMWTHPTADPNQYRCLFLRCGPMHLPSKPFRPLNGAPVTASSRGRWASWAPCCERCRTLGLIAPWRAARANIVSAIAPAESEAAARWFNVQPLRFQRIDRASAAFR